MMRLCAIWKGMVVWVLLVMSTNAFAQAPDDTLFNADGYRTAHYRAPVHAAPQGVGRIAPAALAQLRPGVDMILIDVLPAEGGHREEGGRWRLAHDRPSIPGAHWFPETGRGELPQDVGIWFERGVERLTRGRKDRMLVTFCLADCWMSWNAARRLQALGYTNVWWFAEGTDGWRDLGLPLVNILPEQCLDQRAIAISRFFAMFPIMGFVSSR